MSARTFSRSFNGGEVTPEFWGQVTNTGFQTGLALCRNFVVLPHGPVANRAGFAFVRAAKHAGRRCVLIPFVFSTTQTFALEFGHKYVRFHTHGATLETVPEVAYEVATPYDEADLFDLHYVQSADVLTITHPMYAPAELRRLGPASWSLTIISFAATLAAPGTVAAAATVGTGSTAYTYKVTAVAEGGLQQSLASASATVNNNLLTSGNKNTVTWAAVTGAVRYRVYKESNGLFGFIGETAGLSFVDDNIAADISLTPPEAANPFAAPHDYPGAVAYHEQRRWFAGTINDPQKFWATRSGTEADMTYSLPTRDDDALAFKVASREANTIRHMVPLSELLLLTSAAEWRVTSVNSDAITPTTVSIRPQSYVGASNVPPVVVNNNLIFAAARGGHVRELAYNNDARGYVTGDVSMRAPHLFDGLELVQMAYAKAPVPIIWSVSSAGKLLGFTYVPEQQVGAWHQHDTDGEFESCCCVAEGGEDVLYVVVRRQINGAWVRYVERQRSRQWVAQEDAYFVDCGGTLSSTSPVSSVTGLTWLEGKTVSILADGAVQAPKVVTSGAVALDYPARVVHVGLPIVADLQTLPMVFEMGGAGQGRPKNVNKLWPRVHRSSSIFAGPAFDRLREYKQRTTEPMGVPPRLATDEVQIDLDPAWSTSGQVCIRQSQPLPLTVVSLTAEVAIGG